MDCSLSDSPTGSSRRKYVTLAVLAVLFVGAGCGSPPPTPPPPPQVTVATPQRQNVVAYGEFTGTSRAIESAEIRARVSGELREMRFQPSSLVRKGELLFIIEQEQYQAARDEAYAALRSAQADSARAESDLKRIQLAIQSNAVSEQELDRAQAQRDMANATVLSAKARLDRAELDLSYTLVRSPITGVVSRNLVDVGNLVSASSATLLTTVNKMDPIFVYFEAPERHVLRFLSERAKNTDAPIDRPEVIGQAFIGLSTEAGFPHEGYIDYVDNTVNPTTGTIQLRAVIPNPENVLFPGLFVRVRVPGATQSNSIVIDEKAVATDIGGKYIYVIGDNNIVEQRYIQLGDGQDNGTVVVRDGLEGDESYITNGILRARPGLPVTPVSENAASAGS